jgi:hypothetical protein
MRSALATFAALLILAGCGGDDSSEGTSSLPDNPSKGRYMDTADAICQRLYQERDPLERSAALESTKGKDLAKAASVFEDAAQITEKRVAELKALPRPEGDEGRLGGIWRLGGQGAALGKEAADALRSGDRRQLARASRRGASAQARFDKRAIS